MELEWIKCDEDYGSIRDHTIIGGFVVHRWYDEFENWIAFYCIIPIEVASEDSDIWAIRMKTAFKDLYARMGVHVECSINSNGHCIEPLPRKSSYNNECGGYKDEDIIEWFDSFRAALAKKHEEKTNFTLRELIQK